MRSYKKEKLFKTEIDVYKVEVEFFRSSSTLCIDLIIRIYDKNKNHIYYEKTAFLKKGFSNADLDKEVISHINKYEDWKVCY